MTEQTGADEPTGYDPDDDPDAQPGELNPRTGAAASGSAAGDEDTDAEPANLNPRGEDEGVDNA